MSDEQLARAEEQIMEFTGIPRSSFEPMNVVINDEGDFIRTIRVG